MTSRMFIPNADHYGFINQCIDDDPKHTIISTFGIYAGITYDGRDTSEWGSSYSLETRDIINRLQKIDNVRFLIGVAEYRSCKSGRSNYCIDCEQQYIRTLLRLVFHAEKFPEFEWRITHNLHLKCCLFFYDQDCDPVQAKGVAGGRNFTNSDWADVTFELQPDQIKELHDYTHDLWEEALPATDDSINLILESQKISDKSIKSVVGV